ncbi:MAG TPA: MogA/MoaB family molybdenum cofactor biosynthesis protein [Phycisphaerae bacterium]|nr:MogA/MoaB family molybdenum cofactor biosynthesis protein [Phycisphaerae bacterium]
MGYQDHKAAAGTRAVACAVITCSDSRTEATDDSGRLIRQLLESHGHTHPVHRILRDDPDAIRAAVDELCARPDIQAVIFNGGTGVSRRDNTFDAVSAKLHKTLPGFGELFRMLSYQTIGSGAMLSRATAGIILSPAPAQYPAPTTPHSIRHTLVFSIPGSPNAVELAMNKLILPELPHLVWEISR